MASVFPTVGKWFQDTTTSQLLEIVAVDEDSGTIEVQYDDGAIGEFDLDSWAQLFLVSAAAPEDPGAGYGDVYEDTWQDRESNYLSSSTNPLELIEPDTFGGFDDIL